MTHNYTACKGNIIIIIALNIFILTKPTNETADQKTIEFIEKATYDNLGLLAPGNNTVVMEFQYIMLQDMDTAEEMMNVIGYFSVSWRDNRLAWNHSSGIKESTLELASGGRWFPEMYLSNGLGNYQTINIPSEIHLYSDYATRPDGIDVKIANVNAFQVREFSVDCNIDIFYFPKDKQQCEIVIIYFPIQGLSITTTSVNKLNCLQKDCSRNDIVKAMTKMTLHRSNEWELLDIQEEDIKFADRNKYVYTITMSFARIQGYYTACIYLPFLLFCVMQSSVFVAPMEGKEKCALATNSLLAFTIFLVMLDGIMPKSDVLPFVMYMVLISGATSGINIFLLAGIMNLYYSRDTRHMPEFIKRCILGKLAIWLRVSEDLPSATKSMASKQWSRAAATLERLMIILSILVTISIFILMQHLIS